MKPLVLFYIFSPELCNDELCHDEVKRYGTMKLLCELNELCNDELCNDELCHERGFKHMER